MKAFLSKCQHPKQRHLTAFKELQSRRVLVLAKLYEKATFFTLRNNEIQGGGGVGGVVANIPTGVATMPEKRLIG